MSRNKKFPKSDQFRTLDVPKPSTPESTAPAATQQTFIANGTRFEGSLQSKCSITLDGSLKGELRAPSLKINAGGQVDGKVDVDKLDSCGRVSGEIKAQDVQLSGQVDDNTVIRAKSMEVKLAEQNDGLQVTFGNCRLQVGDTSSATGSTSGSDKNKTEHPNKKPGL